MSRARLLLPVLAFMAAVGFVGCKGTSPKGAEEALGLNKDGKAAAAPGATAETPAPPKPVPAQLPDVLARVNGDTITKAEFDRALKSIEQRAGGPVPPDRRDEIYRGLLEQLVSIRVLRQEAAARKVDISDAELEKRMAEVMQQFPSKDVFAEMLKTQDTTLEKFRTEQRQDLAINKMLGDALKDKVVATPAQIDEFYKQNPDRFKQGERVRASHILIAVPQGADAVTKTQARTKAEGLLKQVKAGGDFAKLAQEHSQDGSASQGGDLNYFEKGRMVQPFEKVAFELKPGQVSDVVQTQFGYHIIKVADHKAERTIPFQEIEPRLKDFLSKEKKRVHRDSFIDGLKKKSKIEVLI